MKKEANRIGTLIACIGLAAMGWAADRVSYGRLATDVSSLDAERRFISDIVLSRARARTEFASNGRTLTVALRLDPSLDGERYAVRVADGRAEIRAGRFRGLLYGAGSLLRSIEWKRNSFLLADGERSVCPVKQLRDAYWARHFYNWYHMASAEELIRYMEDLALWGINSSTFQVWYPVADLKHAQGDDVERYERVSRQVMAARARLDLDSIGGGGGNTAPHDTNPELRAVPNTDPKRGNFGFNVCPAKPGGMEFILKKQAKGLARFGDMKFKWLLHWPADEGGCECAKCRPWGGNGYIKMCKALAEQNRLTHPESKTMLSTWTFHDDEYEMLWKYLATDDSKWIGGLMIDSHEDFPSYPLTHKLPRDIPIVTFPEISMWGREPWGGFGAIAMPARYERFFRQVEKIASGFKYYSEGLSEDINKAVVTQLYVDPTRHWQDIVREYCRWEFPGMDADRFIELVTYLENTQVLPNFKKGKSGTVNVGRGDIPHFDDFEARCRYCLGEATKAEALAAELEKSLAPSRRAYWRWRQIRLRTIIDREILTARTWNTPVADEAYRELVGMYHAERTYSWVRPPRPAAAKKEAKPVSGKGLETTAP